MKGINMKLIFCGGGTVGHITPAIAISEAILKKHPDAEVYFIGRKNGKENEIIKNAGYPLLELEIQGLKRKFSPDNLKAVKNALSAKSKAKKLLYEFKPSAVIGTGGYVCWPVLSAAKSLGIPTVLHESNAVFGLTSRILANRCNLLLLGQNIDTKYKNAFFTGNPIPDNFYKLTKKEAKKALGIPENSRLILSVGGSLGSEKLNSACLALMSRYSLTNNKIYHFHSTGPRYYDESKKLYQSNCEKNKRCKILPYINDMGTFMNAADLVISRCGAMTLSEIAFTKTPSILIPSPNVTGNHQFKNATFFQSKGASIIIDEKNLTAELLEAKVIEILSDIDIQRKMSTAASSLAHRNSKNKIVALICELIDE